MQRRHASGHARRTSSSPRRSHALAQLPHAWAQPRQYSSRSPTTRRPPGVSTRASWRRAAAVEVEMLVWTHPAQPDVQWARHVRATCELYRAARRRVLPVAETPGDRRRRRRRGHPRRSTRLAVLRTAYTRGGSSSTLPASGPGPCGRRGSRTPRPDGGGSPQLPRPSPTRRHGRSRSRHHTPSGVRLTYSPRPPTASCTTTWLAHRRTDSAPVAVRPTTESNDANSSHGSIPASIRRRQPAGKGVARRRGSSSRRRAARSPRSGRRRSCTHP